MNDLLLNDQQLLNVVLLLINNCEILQIVVIIKPSRFFLNWNLFSDSIQILYNVG